MFTVYAEKSIFENIVLFKEKTPHWYSVLCNHSEICLNMTDAELQDEETEGSFIFEFIKANGGRGVSALSEYFDELYENPEIIAEKPRAAFLLNYSQEEAFNHQLAYGVIVLSADRIDDNILKGSFYKDLHVNDIIKANEKIGWQSMINFSLPPSNAMVITDDYLFSNEESGRNIGQENLIHLADALLPIELKVPYHICIISNDQPEMAKPPRSEQWCRTITDEIKRAISDLRPYEIIFEVVFTKTLHKRRLFLNYLNASCDRGFGVFRVADRSVVRSDNDFRCERIFNRIDIQEEGNSDYYSIEAGLMQLKKKCSSVKSFIANSRQLTQNRVLGDCNPDFSLKNRLINDV
jgi:hypothetical protein